MLVIVKKDNRKKRFAKGRGRDMFGACKRSLLSDLPDLSALPTDSSLLPCPASPHSLTTPGTFLTHTSPKWLNSIHHNHSVLSRTTCEIHHIFHTHKHLDWHAASKEATLSTHLVTNSCLTYAARRARPQTYPKSTWPLGGGTKNPGDCRQILVSDSTL